MSSRTSPSSSSAALARSLSPGDESRFVPRPPSSSSLAKGAVDGREGDRARGGHEADPGESEKAFTTAASSDADKDDDMSGIMGTTICFTPETSPRPSSNDLGRGSCGGGGDSIDGEGTGSGGGGAEAAGGTISSAMHVASSLDGRSTTEYELLDGISTRGTLVPEDLIPEGGEEEELDTGLAADEKEESAGCGGVTKLARGENQDRADVAPASLPSPSPCGTVPSLTDTPLKMFKTPQPSETKPPQVPDERLAPSPVHHEPLKLDPELDKADDTPPMMSKIPLPSETNPHQVTNEDFPTPPVRPEPAKPGLKVDDADTNKSPKDSDNAGARQVLSPSKNMYENWETQSGFTGMTRCAIERVLPFGPLRVDSGAKTKVKAAEANEESYDCVGSDFPGETDDSEPKATDQLGEQTGDAAQAIAKAIKFTFSPQKVAGSTISFFLSAIIFAGTFLGAKVMFVQILLRNVTSRDIVNAADSKPGIVKDIPKPDIDKVAQNSDDPSELAGLNLSKMFADKAEEEERKSGLAKGSALQTEVDMCGGSDNGKSTSASDHKKDSSKRGKGYFSGPMAIRVGYGVALCAFVCHYDGTLLEGVAHVAQESGIIFQEEDHVLDHLKEDFNLTLSQAKSNNDASAKHFLCVSTQTTTLFSIPLWEFNLLSASFETGEEEFIDDQTFNQTPSSFGLSTFLILSVVISLFCAFALKSTKSFASIKPRAEKRNQEKDTQNLTGIWTEEEHEQFLMGYNVHGSRWKLVSVFVPTRTHTQVSSHGSYWLKMRSPEKMKKARKTPLAQNTTPERFERKTPITPLLESSTKYTPRKSNKNGPPIKGILLEKDKNQMYKNVTPRSMDRTRRMRITEEGCKSDPIKKRVLRRRM